MATNFITMERIDFLQSVDFADAFEIEILSHAFPCSKAVFFSNQGDNYLNLKIVKDGQLIAFAITQLVCDEANLFDIAVHPEYRGQGYAYQLLMRLIDELEAKAITMLWLEVRYSNYSARKLYERLGFNEVTLRQDYYPSKEGREDAIVMAYSVSFY